MLLNKNNNLIQIILYYVDEEYRRLHPNLSPALIEKTDALLQSLRMAKRNGLLYPFCNRLLQEPSLKISRNIIKSFLDTEKSSIRPLTDTLNFIKIAFQNANIDFLFIKLYRGLAYAPQDIDLLIRPEQMLLAISLLRENGFHAHVFNDVEIKSEKKGFIHVDLYSGFYYLSMSLFSDRFLWKNPRTVDLHGVSCRVPNAEADFVSLLIHSFLGHQRLSLLDFLYAKNLVDSRQLDFHEIYTVVEEYGWKGMFEKLYDTFENVHHLLYSSPNFPKAIRFPLIYSTKFTYDGLQKLTLHPIGSKKMMLFVFSAFFDSAYHKYLDIWQVTPMEIPQPVKKAVSDCLFRIRRLRGDSKVMRHWGMEPRPREQVEPESD